MSNAVFPTLPGMRITVRRTVSMPPVLKRTTPSRRVYKAKDSSLIKYRFGLSFEVLRAGAEAELQAVEAFFKARGGSFDNFLFTAPDDNAVTDHPLGTGNGSQTAFQAVRALGGFAEPIYDLNAVAAVKVSGTPVSFSAAPTTGVITLTAAPAAAAPITWTGTYYWRCFFERDEMDFERFMHQLYELRSVDLITDRS